jgi:hypothetical protein
MSQTQETFLPLPQSATRREALVTGLGLVAGTALLSLPAVAQTAVAAAAAKPAAAPSDLEILTFALSLERLEAAYYAQALGAHQQRAYLTGRLISLAPELAANEAAHVQTLEQAITGAGGTLPGTVTYKFPNNAFISPVGFAWFGYTLEEIGIGAYLGAIGKIRSSALRKSVASIYGAESRHAAILRQASGFNFAPRYFESPLTVDQVQQLIAPYIS